MLYHDCFLFSRASYIKGKRGLVNGRGKALHKGWFGLCLRLDELWVSVFALGFSVP